MAKNSNPSFYEVVLKGSPIMGAYEDKTRTSGDGAVAKRLVVTGQVMFGWLVDRIASRSARQRGPRGWSMDLLPDELDEELEPVRQKRALVIGGGIAGIQAALDVADARIPVTLVEKGPTLGGRMAQLDKTFPTMDCSI